MVFYVVTTPAPVAGGAGRNGPYESEAAAKAAAARLAAGLRASNVSVRVVCDFG